MNTNNIKIKYTLCFIKDKDNFLMLNRIKAPNMGLWNGVGGKLEPNEDKFVGIKREITEETGLSIENVTFKGDVYWLSHNNSGGMHVFIAEYPENSNLNLPIDEVEGILAFKHKDWIFNENNKGIISNIPIFLKKMLMTNTPLEFTFYYDENEIIKSYTFNQI